MIRISIIIVTVLFVLGALQKCTSSPKTGHNEVDDPVIKAFMSSDWFSVEAAKETLESRQFQAIPQLIQILSRDEKVELEGTADLIYPGAKKFYGHGGVLDYDVDWISVRAGWALEGITFQNFGFREGAIKESELLHTGGTKQTGEATFWGPAKSLEVKRQIRSEASARALKWWQGARFSWNRFDAILGALQSNDRVRQLSALSWLRFGKTKCEGLTRESFKEFIEPVVKKLSKSADEAVRGQAELLLDDKEEWWFKYKQEVDKRTP